MNCGVPTESEVIEDKLQTPAEMEESNFTRQLAQVLLAELAGLLTSGKEASSQDS